MKCFPFASLREWPIYLSIIRLVKRLLGIRKLPAYEGTFGRGGTTGRRVENPQPKASFEQMAEALDKREAIHQRTERELRASEERYRSLFEQSRDAIYIVAHDGTVIDVNQATCDLFGYTKNELIGQNVNDIYVDPLSRIKVLQEIDSQGFITDYEVKLRNKDGTELDCLLTSCVRTIDDGRTIIYQGIARDITRRKHTEEALRQSEARYRELFETSYDGIVIADMQGHCLDCNRAFLDLLGYTSIEEIRLRSFMELTPQEYREFEAKLLNEQILVRGYCDEYEKEYFRKTGERIPVSLRIWLRRSSDNRPIGMWAIVNDITGRKHAEEMLRRSKDELELKVAERTVELRSAYRQLEVELSERKLIEEALRKSEMRLTEAQRVSKLGSWEWDITTDKITWSEELYHIFGLTRQEFEATYEAFLQYVHPEDRKNLDRVVKEAITQKKSYSLYHRFIRKDGTVGEMHSRGEIICNGSAQSVLVRGTGQDISELKETEEKLVFSEKRFQAIFENTPLGIVIVDLNRRLLESNSAFQKMIGYNSDELSRMSVSEISYHDDDLVNMGFYQELMEGKIRSFTMEKRYIRKDGTILWGNLTGTLMRNKGNEPVFLSAIVEDITQRKRMEEERERLINELRVALAEVKTLSGMLPICSSCKKIRDDKGYWKQIEAYISEHSEAEFSHGICPDCIKKLYPEYYEKI